MKQLGLLMMLVIVLMLIKSLIALSIYWFIKRKNKT